MTTIAHSHFVEPIRHPNHPAADGSPEIHHPDVGWGKVVMVNGHEIRVRFDDLGVFAWFRRDLAVVASWDVMRLARLLRWFERVPMTAGLGR